MKVFFKRVSLWFAKVIHSQAFQIIISLILGICIWMYVINIVNPLKSSVYTKIPVKIEMDGSVPSYYGLSLVEGISSDLTVTVTVEGSRSGLMNFSKDKISANLDLSQVTTSGGFNLPIKVKTASADVNVVTVEPAEIFCTFDTTIVKDFPIEIIMSGQLADGYVLDNYSVTPSTIEISGPSAAVLQIGKVAVYCDISGKTTSSADVSGISLLGINNEKIGKTNLTVSAETVTISTDISYQKTLPLTCSLINSFGGDESSYIKCEIPLKSVVVKGVRSVLDAMTEIRLESVLTEQIAGSQVTVQRSLPVSADYSYVGINPETDLIDVNLSYNTETVSETKIVFTSEDIALGIENGTISFLGVPADKVPVIKSKEFTLYLRGSVTALNQISKSFLTCVIDLGAINESGDHPVTVNISGELAYGKLNRPYVTVDLVEKENQPEEQ